MRGLIPPATTGPPNISGFALSEHGFTGVGVPTPATVRIVEERIMSSATVSLPSGHGRAINLWFVGAAVVIPTLMGVVGTTIAGVARPYITGALSAAAADSEWVMTSYLAANAFILPVTGWLSAHFGRRNYFLWSIAVFTVASVLCGMATSLPQLILFRVIQGLAAGGFQPSSQAILMDSLPREKQGAAQTMFGIAVLVGPIVGPTLSGWLVVTFSWRWIFYINAPVGLVAFLACYALLEDPDYLSVFRLGFSCVCGEGLEHLSWCHYAACAL